jgi:hypothetical protein
VQRATCFALLGVIAGVLAACGQAPSSPLAPTAAVMGAGAAQSEPGERWGAVGSYRLLGASETSGFPCALGPFGVTEESHFITSPSGHQTLVCTGSTAVPAPRQATILTGFPCLLPPSEPVTVTTDSRLVFTPSGQVTLTCHAK